MYYKNNILDFDSLEKSRRFKNKISIFKDFETSL